MPSRRFLKEKSMSATMRAMINEAIITTMALPCNSSQEGHVTLCISSEYASLKYWIIFIVSI